MTKTAKELVEMAREMELKYANYPKVNIERAFPQAVIESLTGAEIVARDRETNYQMDYLTKLVMDSSDEQKENMKKSMFRGKRTVND